MNEHGREQARLDHEDLEAAWSKLEGYAARLALVLHLARWATDPRVSLNHIDADSMAAGIDLARWFGREARRVYAGISLNDDEHASQRLVDLIRSMPGARTTARELKLRRRRYRTVADAEAALAELAEAHLGRWEFTAPGPKGGRPSKVFVLVEKEASDPESSDVVNETETGGSDAPDGVSLTNGPERHGDEGVSLAHEPAGDPYAEEGCSEFGDESRGGDGGVYETPTAEGEVVANVNETLADKSDAVVPVSLTREEGRHD